jgi:DNA adenine methylase
MNIKAQTKLLNRPLKLANQKSSGNRTVKTALLSPFRYPGGKTWLRPIVRQWLSGRVEQLVEPFAGGSIVALTALNEDFAKRVTLVERDPAVASVWKVILNGKAGWLRGKIKRFSPTRRNVYFELSRRVRSQHSIAWVTLLRNRVSHGGLLAPGAGLLKKGEAGNGIKSRWYPKTLNARIGAIHGLKDRIYFSEADALKWLGKYGRRRRRYRVAYFIDPPYSTAGKRLYEYGEIDHSKLFQIASRLQGRILMTYDDSAEIRALARQFRFKYRRITMRNRHHESKKELLISKNFKWLKSK